MITEANYLSLHDISKSFGSFNALRDIDLDIAKGEFVCFLGPSGCGKTTLLRIIAGLETQDSGSIYQAGKDISWLPPIKRDYGIVFQSYALFPNLTIADNVAYGLVNRGQAKARIAARVQELLTLAGLPTSGGKYPGQLSGGQQQRIALARALATSPGLLLLDEPLSALDALERVRLRSEIRQLQQRLGVTTIMVTHDQEEALSMADRIVVMNHGVIEQIGTPEEIYLKPRSPFVASFIGKINALHGESLGDGRFRLGKVDLRCDAGQHTLPAGQAVKIYLRPEDFVPCRPDRARPCDTQAEIRKIEFLGSHSYLTIAVDGMESQPVLTSIPLNQLEEYGLTVGSRTGLDIVPDRARIFAAQPAAPHATGAA
ncbi:MAG: putative 2-aminoethylphosphonate ABC transporter ATP-binding protein [Noviherbaspirillum sp.]